MGMIAARDFRDVERMGALYRDRKDGATWASLELKYDLVRANGMSAYRVAERYAKMMKLETDPLPNPNNVPAPAPAPAPEPESDEHQAFPMLLRMLKLRLNVMLVGPAGSGKTSGVERASDRLGMRFYPQSVGAQTSLAQLMGYMDANGRYVGTIFRDAFEFGGIFLLDEIDSGNANVLTALNSALANRYCSFPDMVVRKHADFCCCAAGNTWGSGADRMYVGKNQLDASTLDRFPKLVWDYDERLEVKISGNRAWAHRVQSLRHSAWSQKLRVVISPRATLNGAAMLADGIAQSDVEQICIFNGMDDETRKKVLAGAR